jgi:Uri superfamily endonuclease
VVKGGYVLVLALRRPIALPIGRLGAFHFPAGTYAYTGSALGSGGLAARLAHHRRLNPSPHWHVDYLRPHTRLREIWSAASDERLECAWASTLLGLPGAQVIAPRFGASDCRCATHLVYFTDPLPFTTFAQRAVGTNGLQREVLDGETGC